jgi:membrane-associated phospholipid phosphatase
VAPCADAVLALLPLRPPRLCFASPTGAAKAQPMPSVSLLVLAALVEYTGVHYSADVLAGAFIGISAAELTDYLLDRYKTR